ncbi:phosphate ABC transporter permease subunit PstC [Sporichthya sp.]|uniref:phosphate ABC transporter permease subunit PstC n=1 Tax=Sporichthya sp. TaxID=65475 RepID=UPI00182567A1|nr:phosphate ABC transporter permease subunit PstC [Sporichthya sp.]MBA3744022.1 phosphate ABC transporter permease subunit PstC [Sporichthya sp.]
MTTVLPAPVSADAPAEERRSRITSLERSDRIYRSVLRASGVAVLTVMGLVGLFLAIRGGEALHKGGFAFLTTQAWDPDAGNFGIAGVLVGTILIALVAIFFALPLSVGTALYISEYAPRKLQRTLISIVDLMAAVPSVVYGLWGLFFLQGHVQGLARWISTYFGWIPFLQVDGVDRDNALVDVTVYGSSAFIAGMVVALMVTPIACSVMREAFMQAPAGEREGAFALGATKWGMIRSVVLPFGKGGIIGGMMLALGRALGETIAVYLIISIVFTIQPDVLHAGAGQISSLIALRFGEASQFGLSALMAAGLALFLMTLVINFAASSVVARSRSGAESD